MNLVNASFNTAEIAGKGLFVMVAVDQEGAPWTLCEDDCHHTSHEEADKCSRARETAAVYSEPAN
jgi:acyl-CoA hydrolase